MNRQKGWQTIRQCSALFVLASLLAFSTNNFRDSRLPLFGDWSMEARMTDPSGKRLDISIADAKKLFLQQAAVFIDARPHDDYEKGHIKGARSLPWNEVDQKFMQVTQDISPNTSIITYCDGETCELSHNLTKFLTDMGFGNVKVLINGWTLWRESNLPVEKGSDSKQG